MAKIEFVNVTKQYSGTNKGAVQNVTLTVESGTLCMLLGTSGSGKTTLLRMVNRLIDPTSGEIRINGTATIHQDPITLRRSIGYVIQQIGLFPHMTIAENVRIVLTILGKSASESAPRVNELLELVGLAPDEYRNRFPGQLSGGQQQRVGLARALAADPDVLLMDEPFGALDAITRGRIQDELKRIHNETKKTILFVTHDVEEALKLGNQIAIMSEGHLVQQGTPIELFISPANDFVSKLIGADNILRQFEHIPVKQAIEPVSHANLQRIDSSSMLLQALLQLIQSGSEALTVEENGKQLGQVTLSSIYREVQMKKTPVAAVPTPVALAPTA